MRFVTRERLHVDRIATAWAIRRFVDPEASFAFVPRTKDVDSIVGTPFDIRGAELSHRALSRSSQSATALATRLSVAWASSFAERTCPTRTRRQPNQAVSARSSMVCETRISPTRNVCESARPSATRSTRSAAAARSAR